MNFTTGHRLVEKKSGNIRSECGKPRFRDGTVGATPDREAADEENTAAHRYVHVHHGLGNGEISQVEMRLDTPDAEAFDQTVDDLATALAALGHDGDRGTRSAGNTAPAA